MTHNWSTLGSDGESCNTNEGGRRLTRLPARLLAHLRRPVLLSAANFSVRSVEPESTGCFADLNLDIAAKFNLGPKADALAQQIVRLIAGQPEGIAGFLEKLRECGCEAPAALGFGRAGAPLTVRQVKKLVGTPFIKEIAKYLEVPQGFASKVLGAAIPQLAARLAVRKPSPEALPADTLVFPTLFVPGHSRGRAGAHLPLRTEAGYGTRLRFVVPVVTLLFTGGLLGYAVSSAVAGYKNNALPAAVACTLPSRIGNLAAAGDFTVGAGWIKNLTAEADSYNSASPKPLFTGKTLTIKHALQKQATQEAGYSSRVRAVKRNVKSGRASKS